VKCEETGDAHSSSCSSVDAGRSSRGLDWTLAVAVPRKV
jgi:hypothetical protein